MEVIFMKNQYQNICFHRSCRCNEILSCMLVIYIACIYKDLTLAAQSPSLWLFSAEFRTNDVI